MGLSLKCAHQVLVRNDLLQRAGNNLLRWVGDNGRRDRCSRSGHGRGQEPFIHQHRHNHLLVGLTIHRLDREETDEQDDDEGRRKQKAPDQESAQAPTSRAWFFHRSGDIFHAVPIVFFPYGGWL